MKKLLASLFIFGALALGIRQVHASVIGDALLQIQNLKNEILQLKSSLKASVLDFSIGVTSTTDLTPRISYYPGKVNQHVDVDSSTWQTDSDGTSGSGIDKLTYCKKFYPNTSSVSDYKIETINSWHDAGNVSNYVSTRMSYKCVEEAAVVSSVPVVSSPTSSSVTQTSAVLGAYIYSPGTPASSSYGYIYYGTSPRPSGLLVNTSSSISTGAYTVPVSGLTCGTKYYFYGAYTNSVGTGYSSDGTFTTSECNTVTNSISVVSPNGGESYKVGDTMNIKWTGCNAGQDVSLFLVSPKLASPVTELLIARDVNCSDNFYSYKIPSSIYGYGVSTALNGDTYKVWVNDGMLGGTRGQDLSDNYFTISTPTVSSCSDSDGGKNINILGFTDGRVNGLGASFNDSSVGANGGVCTGTSCTGVAEGYCENGKVTNIVIQCSSGYSINGVCAEKVATPTITLISPNGGEVYEAGKYLGSNSFLKYEVKNAPENSWVALSLYKDGDGLGYITLGANVSIPNGIDWKVGSYVDYLGDGATHTIIPGSGYMVEAMLYTGEIPVGKAPQWPYQKGITFDRSNSTFSIASSGGCSNGEVYSSVDGHKCYTEVAKTTPTSDLTPRISYWQGKVNQHVSIDEKMWQTDSDGVSGAEIDKLTYCKKWYPNTTSVVEYKTETINAWHDRGNVNDYPSTRMSYKCVQSAPSSIRVLTPNGGESYDKGQSIKISLEGGLYLSKVGLVYPDFNPNNEISDGNDVHWLSVSSDAGKSFVWDGSSFIDSEGNKNYFTAGTGNYKIVAIRDVNGNKCYTNKISNCAFDISDNVFTIKPLSTDDGCSNNETYSSTTGQLCQNNRDSFVKLVYPETGSTFKVGQSVQIKIDSNLTRQGAFRAFIYRKDTTGKYVFIKKFDTANSGIQTLQIPSYTPSGEYKIEYGHTFGHDDYTQYGSAVFYVISDVYVDNGCKNGAIYSSTTGVKCSQTVDNGCNGTLYSTTTGQLCGTCSSSGAGCYNSGSTNTGTRITRTLRQGLTGDDVKKLQEFLGVKADGVFGRGTAAEVRSWQIANGLNPDGLFGFNSRVKANLNN